MKSILIFFCLIAINGFTQDFEMSQVKTSQNEDELISILVEGKMDLEGSIPSWMVNSFIPSELKKSYGEIINRSKK